MRACFATPLIETPPAPPAGPFRDQPYTRANSRLAREIPRSTKRGQGGSINTLSPPEGNPAPEQPASEESGKVWEENGFAGVLFEVRMREPILV